MEDTSNEVCTREGCGHPESEHATGQHRPRFFCEHPDCDCHDFQWAEEANTPQPEVEGTLRAAQGDGQSIAFAEEKYNRRCRDCEGDISTGWVTLCSLHAAAPALAEQLRARIEELLRQDADGYKKGVEDAAGAAYQAVTDHITGSNVIETSVRAHKISAAIRALARVNVPERETETTTQG